MKIGINLNIEDLKLAQELQGYDFIEISNFIFPQNIQNEKMMNEVKNILNSKKYNINCLQGPIRDIKPESGDTEILTITEKRFKTLIDLASENNVKYILFSTTYDSLVKFNFYTSMWLENNINFWRKIIDYSEKKDVVCLYCNVWDDTPQYLKVLFQTINSEYFKFAFDIGHAHFASKLPLEEWFNELDNYIGYILIHDNCGNRDDHLCIGEGNIQYEKLMPYIKKMKNRADVCIQLFNMDSIQECLNRLNKLFNEKQVN